jgi:hypothetical protein
VLAGTDEAGLVRDHDGVDAIAQVELGQDAVDVRLDGRFSEDESRGDLAVGEARGDESGPRPRAG